MKHFHAVLCRYQNRPARNLLGDISQNLVLSLYLVSIMMALVWVTLLDLK